MPTFVGLIPAQKTTLTADVIQAVQVAKRAVNSLVLSAVASPGGPRGFAFGIRPPIAKLLNEAFGINETAPDPDQVEKVKNVFFSFDRRMQTTTFTFDPSPAKPGTMEFEAYTDRAKPNTIFFARILCQSYRRATAHASARVRAPRVFRAIQETDIRAVKSLPSRARL